MNFSPILSLLATKLTRKKGDRDVVALFKMVEKRAFASANTKLTEVVTVANRSV